jgi:hypothetical protein
MEQVKQVNTGVGAVQLGVVHGDVIIFQCPCNAPPCAAGTKIHTAKAAQMLVALVIATAAAAPAWAVNKCTEPDGKVSFQDAPCAATSKAETLKTRSGNTVAPQGGALTTPKVEPNLKLEGPKEAAPLLAFYRQWIDNEKLLESTARIALAGPVATMQKLLRDVEAYQAQPCLTDAKKELAGLISSNTEATIQFMQKQEVSNMAYQWVHRPKMISAFERAVATARCVSG